jgi:NAD(P)-dependent dehydrogenase (short-subunit alcohol dehydrogenase family)
VGLAIVQAIAAKSTPQILYAGSRAGKDLGLSAGSEETAIHYVKLDISDSASIDALVDRIKQDGGRVDRLINNVSEMFGPKLACADGIFRPGST